MPKIEWTDKLSMGVEEIDHQHKTLIRIANGLINAVSLNREPRVLNNVIRRLREYTVFHFNSEEALMEKTHYPHRGQHASLHRNLKDSVKKYQRRFYEKKRVDPESVQQFLQFWILNHILEADREFADFLHGQKSDDN